MPKHSKAFAAPSAKSTKAAKPPPHLLTIPLELREHIYTELLPEDASALFQLLLTNRQLSREAKPFTFKQPLAFDGQSELYAWLPRVDRRFLRYVNDVQFKLHDIDPEKIVGALGKRLRHANITAANSAHAPVGNPYDEACDLEMDRLGHAFSFLPNVKHFTVLPTTDADPRPSYHMLVSFSNLLSRRFPHLFTLTNHEEFLPARFLSSLQNLRRLCFSGMSTSPPAEVTALVRGLPNLVELEINRLDVDTNGRQSELYSRIATSHQCNYAELTRGLPGLESLAFYGESCDQDEDDDEDEDEDDDDVAEIPEATRIFMGALDGHRSPLQKLQLFASVDSSFESRVQKKLATFKTSNLVHLETFHAHFPGFEFLPSSLRTLVLWSSERDVPFESSMKALVSTAKQHRSSVPNLGNLLIHLDVENWGQVRGARGWLCQRMESLGIRLSWKYWDGFLPK